MTQAFKEWSYIVEALGSGKQSIILRKGGIDEDGNGFEVKANKFLLLPTLFHQAEQHVKPDWFKDFDPQKFQISQDEVKIEYFAQIVEVMKLSDWEKIAKLDPFHAWKESIILERFNRWEKNVHLLIVQVFKLHHPYILTLLPEYSGCKSWVTIDKEIPLEGEMVKNKSIMK